MIDPNDWAPTLEAFDRTSYPLDRTNRTHVLSAGPLGALASTREEGRSWIFIVNDGEDFPAGSRGRSISLPRGRFPPRTLFCCAVLALTWFAHEASGNCVTPCCKPDTVVH